MRHALLALSLATAIASAHASEHGVDAAQRIQGALPQVTAWRREIHQHPELSNRETRTAALVAAQLKKLGLEVRTGIAHTGVVGILKGGQPGPKLAIRADMDALPVTEEVDLPFASKAQGEYRGKSTGVMHACGHDTHTAMLLGLATVLAGMRQELSGEVMFLFQPAEEGAPAGEQGGAPLMLQEGVFRDFAPDAMFAMHVISTLNAGTVAVRPGPALSGADGFKLVVHGRQTHGAMPWHGVDPIVTAAQIVTQAQTIVSRRLDIGTLPAVLSFGIVEGGARHNIVPDKVELQGTLRTFDPAHAPAGHRRPARHRRARRRGERRHGGGADPDGRQRPGHRQRSDADRAGAREPGQGDRRRTGARSAAGDAFRGFRLLRQGGAQRLFLRRRHARRTGSGQGAGQSFAPLLRGRGRAAGRHALHAAGDAGLSAAAGQRLCGDRHAAVRGLRPR